MTLAISIALWALVLVVAGILAGRALGSREGGLAKLAWDGACGLALLMALLVALGQIPGAFRPAVLAALIAVLAIGAAIVARWSTPATGPVAPRATWGLLVLVAIAGFVWSRVPTVFFDALAYHLAQPNLWLVNGRIAPEAWSITSWFPPGMSVLYGLGLAFGGDTGANGANVLLALIVLALVADTGTRLWGPAEGVVAAAILATLPIFVHALGIPAADLGHGAFVFGALAAMLLATIDRTSPWIARAAILAGGALLTKYLGVLVPLAVGVPIVFAVEWRARRSGPVSAAAKAAAFAAVAFLMVVPWLAANSRVVGNPLAPALDTLWPSASLAPGGAAAFHADARGGVPDAAAIAALVPGLVSGASEDAPVYPSPAWGWLPVVFSPLAVLALRRDRQALALAALFGATVLIWLATYRWERFLVAATAILALLLARGLVLSWRRRGVWRALGPAAAVLAGLTLVQAGGAVGSFTGGGGVALGREAPDDFLGRSLPCMALFDAASRTLDPKRDRVLLVGEMRHHRLDVPHAAPMGFNRHPLAEILAHGAFPEEASAALRERGFTHAIVDRNRALRDATRYPSLAVFATRPGLLDAWIASLGAPIASERGVALYALPNPDQKSIP